MSSWRSWRRGRTWRRFRVGGDGESEGFKEVEVVEGYVVVEEQVEERNI